MHLDRYWFEREYSDSDNISNHFKFPEIKLPDNVSRICKAVARFDRDAVFGFERVVQSARQYHKPAFKVLSDENYSLECA
jgi:hypothetical protein